MSVYNTTQRSELIRFLKKHSNDTLTIAEIYKYMCQDSDFKSVPAQSSIHRLIKNMVEDGIVRRISKGNSRHFVYQIILNEDCKKHLHLKCSVCGKIYHLSNETSEKIKEDVFENNSFYLGSDTILSGKCKNCK